LPSGNLAFGSTCARFSLHVAPRSSLQWRPDNAQKSLDSPSVGAVGMVVAAAASSVSSVDSRLSACA